MSDRQLPAIGGKTFEALKQTNEHGAEYWSARDLQPLLGYSQWRRFEQAVERAITSCKESGNNPGYHFAGVGKMIEVGKGGVREVPDYHLSRFACYLIAQNGDPRKPEIAQAQKYFAVQARDKERKAIMKQWAKREEQIGRVIGATVGMYGDLQGIAGKSLQEIEELSLLALSNEGDKNVN